MFDLFFHILVFLVGLLLPAVSAYPLLEKTVGLRTSRLFTAFASFPFGWGFLTISLFFLNLILGVRISLLTAGFVLIFMCIVSLALRRPFYKNDNPATATKTVDPKTRFRILLPLVIAAVAVWTVIGALAVSKPVDCIPGFGAFGYKAMVIAKTGDIPVGDLTDKDRPYLHQEYPLGYPVMLAYSHLCLGGFDDRLVKLLPFLTSFLCFLLTVCIFSELGVPPFIGLLLSLTVSSGGVFAYCATTMYAEPLLLLMLLPGFFLLYRYMENRNGADLFFGLLFMAMSAWVKNEGLVYFGLTLSYLVMESLAVRRNCRKCGDIFLYAVIAGVVFIMPWQTVRHFFHLGLYDFSFSRPFSDGFATCGGTVLQAWKTALDFMFRNLSVSGGAWILIFAAMLLRFRPWRPVAQELFVWYCIFGTLFVFTGIFFFSVRPMHWHLNSLVRLLTVSGILVVPYALSYLVESPPLKH